MNAYLQEERQRCQELASALGREQQGSESRAAEVARLSALAQHSTEEVMAAREAAQAERSRAEQLLRDKAELQGKVGGEGGKVVEPSLGGRWVVQGCCATALRLG